MKKEILKRGRPEKYPVFEKGGIQVRECSKCHEIKTLENFKMKCCKTNRRNNSCRVCDSNFRKNQLKENPRFYKDKYFRAKQLNPNYLEEHKERQKYVKINKELRRETRKRYVRTEKHRAYQREYYHKKIKTNINSKIKNSLRGRIRRALIGIAKKSAKTMKLVGCSIEFFIKYIESKFQEGMNWDNYGRGIGRWEIDHIIPCAYFDLTHSEEQNKCFHYTNLQPLWSIDNSTKGDKLPNGGRGRNIKKSKLGLCAENQIN